LLYLPKGSTVLLFFDVFHQFNSEHPRARLFLMGLIDSLRLVNSVAAEQINKAIKAQLASWTQCTVETLYLQIECFISCWNMAKSPTPLVRKEQRMVFRSAPHISEVIYNCSKPNDNNNQQ